MNKLSTIFIILSAALLSGCVTRRNTLENDFQLAVRMAQKEVYPALVYIRVNRSAMESSDEDMEAVRGSGVLISANGEVLTNLTSAAGAASIVFRNRETSNSLVLTYDGNDEGALVAHTSLKRNSTVMIFR